MFLSEGMKVIRRFDVWRELISGGIPKQSANFAMDLEILMGTFSLKVPIVTILLVAELYLIVKLSRAVVAIVIADRRAAINVSFPLQKGKKARMIVVYINTL